MIKNVKIVYLQSCAHRLNIHISESVFVSFVGNSQFQRQKVRYLFPLVHVHAVSPRVCGTGTPYMPSVEYISSFSLSRPCEASHKINESRLHTFVLFQNAKEARHHKHIVMNTNGSIIDPVKQEYVSPCAKIYFIASEQSILVYSNEHTEEEDLF